ncbi:MAG: hypothetical protein J6S21_03515, partial [Victivallales bacterium]|nr:hypothetical protein [Victivallales bacterium]
VIPNPAIHLADLNNGFKYNPQFHLAALVPHRCIKGINEKRRGHGAVEMWLTDAQPPTDLGDGLINAPRLDNLASCYAGLKAICTADPKKLKQIPVLACFDLEECGDNFNSARGTLLDTVFLALRRFYQLDDWDFNAMCARSWMVSGDAAHAHHPNFPDLHDHAYAPIMGRGIVLKSHANQHYATTPAGEAFFEHHCRKAGLTSQRYVVRSDMRCGSTIGPACATRTGIPTIDVGIPLLAMHSIRETAHLNDIIDLVEFFSAVIHG